MLHSDYHRLCFVRFPEFQNRQHYMHEFDPSAPSMPEGFEDYTSTIARLLEQVRYFHKGKVYVTIDEKIIQPGMSQRRPGPHVDGCFMPSQGKWGHPSWAHYCNNLPVARMPVIVAASVPGCRVWVGQYDAQPKNDGSLSHIKDQLGEGRLLNANTGYVLTPDCIHESIIFNEPTQRSFLRIALSTEFKV